MRIIVTSYINELALVAEGVRQTYTLENVIDSMAITELSRYIEHLKSSAPPAHPTSCAPTCLAAEEPAFSRRDNQMPERQTRVRGFSPISN